MARMPDTALPPSSTSFQNNAPLPWLLGLALGVALLSALAPHYEASGVQVSPLAAALVLALGATALWGSRALPAVAVGAALGSLSWPPAVPGVLGVVGALTLVLQAAAGGLLLRRSSRSDDLALDTRPAIRRLLAAALACGAIGGLLHMLADLIGSPDPTLRPGTLLLVRAIADAASIVIGLPVLLAFFSPQRARWMPRRRIVAAPLLALVVLMLGAFALIDERDHQQAQSRFERDAEIVLARTQALLDAPVQTLLALQGAFNTAPGGSLSAAEFDSLAQPWVRRSLGVGSVGWMEVSAAPATAATAASGVGAASKSVAAIASPELRHVMGSVPLLPAAASAPARTVLDLPSLRQSAQRATLSGTATISPPLLVGSGPDARPGFVVLQSLPPVGSSALRALAFATVTADTLVAPVLATRADAMRACLFDTDARLDVRRLAGPSGCETATIAERNFVRESAFDFGGRRWAMRVSQPVRTSGGVWLFALPALAGGALLSVLLVGMTGQVQRARHEARSRSDELQHEMDQHLRAQALQERTVSAMLDTAQIGMAVIDPDGRIQRANAAFADLAGDTPEALRQKVIDDVLVDAERPAPQRFTRLMQEASDDLVHQSMRLRNSDGRVTPALVTLSVLRGDGGRAVSAVCAVHDLSENLRRRQVEQVLGNVMELSRGETRPAGLPPADGGRAAQRVLCISGHAELPEELRSALHDRSHITLLCASGGPEGLLMARSQGPDCVLLDLDLPDADALALMARLSEEGLPVIALSQNPRPARIDQAFAAGARAYLTMPLEPRELLAVLDDLG